MNKEEFRKHCEEQIEMCIKLHDSKHLKEHELSLALLNECEQKKQNQENLIKYIEEKIKSAQKYIQSQSYKPQGDLSVYYYYAERDKKTYKDLLERIKSNNYEM